MNGVPDSVKNNLGRHLRYMREAVGRLEAGRKADARFSGGGRYEWECLMALLDDEAAMRWIRAGRDAVAEFRFRAAENGVFPDPILEELGGVPDPKVSAKAIAFMTDDGKRPLPEKVAAYVKEFA